MPTNPRRIGRLALILGAAALAGSTAFLTWWTTTLMGLPDVGDPFDVAAFCRPIADESNAFVLYRQAAAILPEEPPDLTGDWKTATPAERGWLDRNREALALWLSGTERPDALYIDPGVLTFETRLDVAQKMRTFCRLVLLEGSKLEEAGDLEGAFDRYRALLRSSRHCGRRGTFIERLIGMAMHNLTCARLTRWAADPRVDARLLRLALDAAIAAEAATAPISDGLKAEYVSLLHSIGRPELMARMHDYEVVPNNKGGSVTKYGQNGWKSGLIGVRRRLINEPERSRRVIRMIFANWLACCDLPAARQPPWALSKENSTTISGHARDLLARLYRIGGDPAPARSLSPEKLAGWYATTIDAEAFLPNFEGIAKSVNRERSVRGALIVSLANELHRREHGRYPERVEDLVGPYLKTLPEDDKPSK